MLTAGQSDTLNAHIHLLPTRQALSSPGGTSKPTCSLMFGVDSVGLFYYIFSTLSKHETK